MSLAAATLPSDPEDLRVFARSLQLEMQREIAVRRCGAVGTPHPTWAELHAKTLHIEKLKAQLAVLKRARFGRSSEQIEQAIEQLELTIGELEENQAQAAARATALGAEPAPSPADRASSARRQRTVPLLQALRARLDATLARISAKTAPAGAIRYATSRWQALTRFAHDGRLEISNNAAERAIRPITLNRKNALFAGSDVGGERAASIYTLIESPKINGLDLEAYLTDVIARIADHPVQR